MVIEALGDSAFVLRNLPIPADEISRFLNLHRPIGLIEAVASYETVGLYVDPDSFDLQAVLKTLPTHAATREGKTHLIPVCYELGPDLEEVSTLLDMSVGDVVAAHVSTAYRCYAVGFCPGFPYLGYLPDVISGVGRLAAPRKRIEPGMVGITGRQTGVYPLARPGGWRLIGQTPLELVCVEDDYFPIEAGDSVRFEAIMVEDFEALRGERL